MTNWVQTRSTEQLVEDATALYTEHFSGQPEGVWAAPGRVNLIGDHVDYAGGISIPFALGQRTAAAVGTRTDGLLKLVSVMPDTGEASTFEIPLQEVGPLNPNNWAGYAVGAVWAGLESGIIPSCDGLNIALTSDVPLGSGLSSSAALECAVAVAAFELATGHGPDASERAQLVDACIRAENEVVGASTGGLDQRASLFGSTGHALAIDFQADTVEEIPCDMDAAGLALLIANTNAPHSLNDGQYASRRGVVDAVSAALGGQGATIRDIPDAAAKARTWASENDTGQDAETVYRRINHVVEETDRTAAAARRLAAGDWEAVRELMSDSHISLRDQFEVVTDELESAYLAAGSIGARMTGGGFGGSVIALVKKEDVDSTAEAIAQAARDKGMPEPTFMVATPSEGATRIA